MVGQARARRVLTPLVSVYPKQDKTRTVLVNGFNEFGLMRGRNFYGGRLDRGLF
jgi:hypothetical protein